jgi:hypothetical protein
MIMLTTIMRTSYPTLFASHPTDPLLASTLPLPFSASAASLRLLHHPRERHNHRSPQVKLEDLFSPATPTVENFGQDNTQGEEHRMDKAKAMTSLDMTNLVLSKGVLQER